jgi:hypothetical protein
MPPRTARFDGKEGGGRGAAPDPVADKCRLSAREITWRLVRVGGEYSGALSDAAYYRIGIRSRNLPVSHETTLT